MTTRRTRTLIALAFLLLAMPTAVLAQSGGRSPYEAVMRQVQGRYRLASEGYAAKVWPPCCYGDGNTPAPAYPPDGYYGPTLGPRCSVRLVAAIVDAVKYAAEHGAFLKESCWDISGHDETGGLEYLTLADLGFHLDGDEVTEGNYGQMFSLAQAAVMRMRYVRVPSARPLPQYNLAGDGSANANDLQTTCSGALSTANGRAVANRGSTWHETNEEYAIGKQECAGASTPTSNGFLESNYWFDAEGRTIAEWAPSGDTVVVQYGYTNSAAPTSGSAGNYSRMTSLKYPSGNTINYGYGAGADLDDRISRLSSIANPGDNDPIVEYSRVGLDMFAVVDYPLSEVQLDRTFSHDGKRRAPGHTSQNAATYPGWDRHGRVAIQAWLDGTLDAITGAHAGYPTRPPIVDEGYTYDAASNRKSKDDLRPGVKWTAPDARYDYDGLDRLIEAKKDTHTASTFGTKKGSHRWTLDVLGNWTKLEKELNNSNPYTDSGETEDRDHNMANEITHRYPTGHTSGQPDLPFAYDDAGNLKQEHFNSTTSHTFVHDAWNRMVRHSYAGEMVSLESDEYEYNGLHWRTVKRIPPEALTLGDDPPTGGTLKSMYYSAAWQLLEERVNDNYLADPTIDRVEQEVWGMRYIDDAVMRLSSIGSSFGVTKPDRFYHLTDVQFSTVAMIGIGGDPEVIERVRYDAYGKATHRWGADLTDDDQVNNDDKGVLATAVTAGYHIYDSGYDVSMDLNRDGVIDNKDGDILTDMPTVAALADGDLSDRSTTGPDNVFGYDGYVFAPELQRYCVRFRWYDPVTGRWLERDPAGYVDGANLYSYLSADPLTESDPTGLQAAQPQGRTDDHFSKDYCDKKKTEHDNALSKLTNIQDALVRGGCEGAWAEARAADGSPILIVFDSAWHEVPGGLAGGITDLVLERHSNIVRTSAGIAVGTAVGLFVDRREVLSSIREHDWWGLAEGVCGTAGSAGVGATVGSGATRAAGALVEGAGGAARGGALSFARAAAAGAARGGSSGAIGGIPGVVIGAAAGFVVGSAAELTKHIIMVQVNRSIRDASLVAHAEHCNFLRDQEQHYNLVAKLSGEDLQKHCDSCACQGK